MLDSFLVRADFRSEFYLAKLFATTGDFADNAGLASSYFALI